VDFEQLASSLDIPYRTFRHVFGKETGTSPHQYQLEIRLARAKNLLRSTNMPISDIAETLGFNSTWYFSHFFQKRCRTSAAAYRKLSRQA
jgi:AraC family transcriptional regulator